LNFIRKETYTMDDLLRIMEILRSPQGCPWDREQTHKTIRNNFLEEAYEAVEAIDTSDSQLLCEELGDVLLQVVFHSQLEKEPGVFFFFRCCGWSFEKVDSSPSSCFWGCCRSEQ
jgi:tetrapyrrole methylase family protein / MazG family protein